FVGLAGGPRPHRAGLRVGQEDHLNVAQRAAALGDGPLDRVEGELRSPAATEENGESAQGQPRQTQTVAAHFIPLNQKAEPGITPPLARVLRAGSNVGVLLIPLLRKRTEPSQKEKVAPWVWPLP